MRLGIAPEPGELALGVAAAVHLDQGQGFLPADLAPQGLGGTMVEMACL